MRRAKLREFWWGVLAISNRWAIGDSTLNNPFDGEDSGVMPYNPVSVSMYLARFPKRKKPADTPPKED